MMKKINLLLLFLIIGLVSCTKNFGKLNSDPNGIPYVPNDQGGSGTDVVDASITLPGMMDRLYPSSEGNAWLYQQSYHFTSGVFSGYWMQASKGGFGTGTLNQSNYTLVHAWDDNVFTLWSDVMNNMYIIQTSTYAHPNATNKAVLGMSYVVKVIQSSRTADAVGTMPYTSFGTGSSKYDGLQTIYTTFFSELDSALTYLDPTVITTSGIDLTKDYFYAGNQQKWIKLANSMRLRLAMRLSKVDPEMAQAQITNALEHTGGLIMQNADNAYSHSPGVQALTVTSRQWGPDGIGADIYSFAVGWNDPRLSVFLSPTSAAVGNTPSDIPFGSYVTKRLGTTGISTAPAATAFSYPGTGIPAVGTSCDAHPQSCAFFNAAETNFLLAETALRGWLSGSYNSTPDIYYADGIRASMNQWGVDIGTYLSSTAEPASYTDPSTPAASVSKAASSCKPSWGSASTNEGHLEQIITQKWLALWPMNHSEAWSEYRRTGYPKLFPGYFTNLVAPTIQWGGLTVNNARKIMIPLSEYNNNSFNVQQAITNHLGGTDAITTHVWWDVDKPNFIN